MTKEVKYPIKKEPVRTEKMNNKLTFKSLQPVAVNSRPLKLSFFTPITIRSSEWKTVADFTKIKNKGITSTELLKYL